SAQLAELQGEHIAEVLKKQWNNEPLPDKMPEIKVQGFLGSLGDKQGFDYIMDRTVTGRLASILKSCVM
ncbi:NAD(P)/FAD-dependent oxidoreductase, partial [Bacillus cereus]